MLKRVIFSVLVSLILGFLLVSQSSSAQEYVPGQLIVKFRTGITKAGIASINREIGARVIEEIRLIEAQLVKITAPITVERAIELYARNPDVEYAQPNYIGHARGHLTRPDDPDFPKQWGLDNKGQEIPSLGNGRIDADIDAPQGWEHETECTKIIAILDTGIDWGHPDLAQNIWMNLGEVVDGIDNDGNGYIDDTRGWDFVESEDLDSDNHLDLGIEDIDGDGNFDTGEDTNHNGILDPNEDDGPAGLPPLDDGDGVLDPNEDLNGNGIFEPPNEDIDGDGNFDTGEDINHNGVLDPWEDLDSDGILDLNEDLDNDRHFDTVNEDGNGNGILDKGDKNPMDENGHGTHVAGIIGAIGNNGKGVSGVCWKAQLMTVRVMDASGDYTEVNEIHAIDYAITNGASVINFSGGGYYPPSPAEQAALTAAHNAGVLFITAAGYETPGGLPGDIDVPGVNDYPCKYTHGNIICVGASDNQDRYVGWCNWGTVSVDVAAPGDCIFSTMPRHPVTMNGKANDCTGANFANNYDYMSGTSMATPYVSGVAAHCWSLFPNDSHLDIKARMEAGVDPRPSIEDRVRWGQGYDPADMNNGRLRICCGDDFGDAPDPPYPTLKASNGARHEDIGEEWFGDDVSPEFDADTVFPYDADGPPNLVDNDFYDDGVRFFLPYRPGQLGRIDYKICTENNDVDDCEEGRYKVGVHNPDWLNDDKNIYVNFWFDWNKNGDWDDPGEHVLLLNGNKHNPRDEWGREKCSDWITNWFFVPEYMETCAKTWVRARLDYGENCALQPPFPRYDSDHSLDPPEPVDTNQHWYGLAQYGEVEDYFLGKSNVFIPNTDTCVNPGDYVCLPILLKNNTTPFGGFELEIEFDYTSMTFVSAEPGELLDCFELFTYRLLPCPSCGCCKYKILLYGQYDIPNGGDNIGCPIPMTPYCQYKVLLELCFVVNNDETLRGLKIPVCWEWEGTVVNDTLVEDWNCQENTFSSWSGDTLYTSNLLCQFNEELCDDPTDRIVPAVSFQYDVCGQNCGGVDVCPADEPGQCKRGDVNFNTMTYEVADAVLFASYFVEGTSVFRYDEAYQICATDVNADGRTLTLSDLVYLIRVILRDAVAIHKLTPSDEVANVIVSGGTISTECAASIGAILFEFDGAVVPTLLADMEMVSKDNKVLVWSSKGKSFSTGQVLTFEGEAELVSATAVDRDSRELATSITGKVTPLSFALHPAYPNPFNIETQIRFSLPTDCQVTLKIYNINGQLVKTLADQALEAGRHTISWDGTNQSGSTVASGVYFYKLTAADFSATEKMVLMK